MLDEPRVGSQRHRDGPQGIDEHANAFDAGIVVTLAPLPPRAELAELWRALEVRADGSAFTSWSWIDAWLSTSTDAAIALVSARQAGRVVALALLTRGPSNGLAGILGRYRLALHRRADGKDAALFIEYNDILVDRSCARAARSAVLQFLIEAPPFALGAWSWGELDLPGLTRDAIAPVRELPLVIEERARECAWVDFARARRPVTREDYLSTLTRNTRAQLRRAFRIAEADGTITLTVARGSEQRRHWLAELRDLHQDSWQRLKGKPGAFSAPVFAAVAEALVRDGGDTVELARISAGDRTLGLLLNFVHRGHVYAYQSGFAYRDDNRFKPGLICHAQAIVHSARAGRAGYHFMAGESRYKTSLATASETLFWVTLRRPGALTTLERKLSALKARFKRHT
jgi:CelD/BcsL family acetyltransferase involved in cellulose biosynthesis